MQSIKKEGSFSLREDKKRRDRNSVMEASDKLRLHEAAQRVAQFRITENPPHPLFL